MELTWGDLTSKEQKHVRDRFEHGKGARFVFFEMRGIKKSAHRDLARLLNALDQCGPEGLFLLDRAGPQLEEEAWSPAKPAPICFRDMLRSRIESALRSTERVLPGRHPDFDIDDACSGLTHVWRERRLPVKRGQDPRAATCKKTSPYIRFVASGLMELDPARFRDEQVALYRAYSATKPQK